MRAPSTLAAALASTALTTLALAVALAATTLVAALAAAFSATDQPVPARVRAVLERNDRSRARIRSQMV